MQSWEWPEKLWIRIHVDHAGPFMGLLIIVDAHSKWIEVFIVNIYIEKLRWTFATHGLPEVLVSDNRTVFSSAEFQQFMNEAPNLWTLPSLIK
jgi:hypothetical protein